jgi:GTP-binding protein EngB required for normal cell division
MQLTRPLRVLLALGFSLLLLLVLIVVLLATESVFSVWDRLQEAPAWFFYAYLAGFLVLALGGGWLVWRLLVPVRRQLRRPAAAPAAGATLDREEIERRLRAAEAAGVDVESARRELQQLSQRHATGSVHVCLYGEISSGKSSLIRALMPDADAAISVTGGTTRELAHYRWYSPAGDALVLTDMPGLNEAAGELDQQAREEAQRAHVVVYLCDGDLARSQFDELVRLLELRKPCILALNKTDRYRPDELKAIRSRLETRMPAGADVRVVGIRTGGTREVVRVLPDGREEVTTRALPPDVDELRLALQRVIDRDPAALETLRDSSVFVLVARKLDDALAAHRRVEAEALVNRYSRRAVIGALAAVTPGTDVLIQGYLGMNLVKELCALYEVPVRKIDLETLLDLVQRHVGKTLTLVLAIAGNGLKAFPGVGTLAGGLVHAVAYGMIFDTLGRAVATTLDTRGELHPVQAAVRFKETLGEDLDTSARRFASMALAERRADDSD